MEALNLMNIVVLCGGLSAERDVSISSGTQIARALRARGHRVVLMDLFFGYQGAAYSDPVELFTRDEDFGEFSVSESEPDLDAIRRSRNQPNDSVIGDNVLSICAAADVTFMALHGDDGENGKLQAALDIAGIRYTGSGYLGSALAMNKDIAKCLFREAGIKTPDGFTLHGDTLNSYYVSAPCVVKPGDGGSSVGTSIVTRSEDLPTAVEAAKAYSDTVLVEEYIAGRELTVGVLGDIAMPVIEIIPKQGFYDYKNKYQAGLTEEVCPANLTAEETAMVQAAALAAHKALRLRGYSRMDGILTADGVLYVLEVNTLPGMTPTSLIPQMGAAMGMSFVELCERIIEVSR